MKKNLKNKKLRIQGITLIALVITIIVLLILARSKYININRRQKYIKEIKRSKSGNKRDPSKRIYRCNIFEKHEN